MSSKAFVRGRTKLTVGCGLVCWIVTLVVSQAANGQLFPRELFPRQLFSSQRVNSDFIPASGFAGAALFPKQLAEDPKFDLFPREIVTAWGQKELGFDPMLIKQITVVVREMDGLNQRPQWGGILHFAERQGVGENLVEFLNKSQLGDKSVFSSPAIDGPSLLIYDETTMFVGDKQYFEEMLAANHSGKLVGLFEDAEVKGQLVAFVDVKSVRPMLNEAMMQLPVVLPPAMIRLKKIPNLIDALEVGVKVDGRVSTKLIMHAADNDSAEEVQEIIADALEFGGEMAIGMLAAQMDFSDPVQVAVVEYAQRVKGIYQDKLTPRISGSELAVELDEEASVVPFLVGMLLPAVQQARTAARRATSMNNCRQMGLACLNYESAMGHFPTQGSYDENGKPLLSWRVHTLPFIDQQELYEQFHLDEPWDSPHNKKLIEKMPAVYQSPLLGDFGGKTVYLGIAGEGMMFGKDKKSFGDILDGSSNTVFLVEADADHAVVWTKPEDLEVDKNNPLKGLGHSYPGGFIANMADGSVVFIRNDGDEKTWLKLLTIADGEAIGLGDY